MTMIKFIEPLILVEKIYIKGEYMLEKLIPMENPTKFNSMYEGGVSMEKLDFINNINDIKENNEVYELQENNETYELQQKNIENIDTQYQDDIGLKNNIEIYTSPEGIESIRDIYPNVDIILKDIEDKLGQAKNPLELQKIDSRIETYKGTVFEDINKECLKDKFESIDAKQSSIETSEGVTKPDITLHDAKEDMKIGDLSVKKGEDLSVEVKCGSPEYIRSEMNHMLKQVLGHEGNSLVIVTKDYEKIDSSVRAKFESELKERGSHIYVAEVYADEVSNAIRGNLNY